MAESRLEDWSAGSWRRDLRTLIDHGQSLLRDSDLEPNALHAVGLSELVKDREAIFLSELERDITILDPVETKLVPDTSPRFRDALLYIETFLIVTDSVDGQKVP